MLCPLKKLPDTFDSKIIFGGCDQEKCAWWVKGPNGDPGNGRCAVLDMAFSLGELSIFIGIGKKVT